jgi:hypothetical protein
MARLERKERADGGSSYMVRWRLGGTRTGSRQPDTLGEDWPDGWVKGQGFVRDRVDADSMVARRGVSTAGAVRR